MNPIKPTDGGDAAATEPQSFSDALKSIDVSSLDRLIEIRKENARLSEYRTKANEKKNEVAEAVYTRVSQDYAKRAAALESQSAPLRTEAREEYRKLKALLASLDARQAQAQFQKDELQFRNIVGELDDGALAARLVDSQRALDQCAIDRKEVDAIKTRFIDALGSEEALEAPSEQAPPPHGAPPRPPVEQDRGETRVAQPAPAVSDMRPIATATAPPPPTAAAVAAAVQNAPAPASSPRPAPAVDDVVDGATVMLATAAVVVEGPAGKDYPLTVLNGIGRSEENRICLSNPGISRKHATISAVAGGFMIKDLGSQNGTFVNGQRITEKKLTDGDTIGVGSVKFVFRTPWPPRPGAAARAETAAQAKQ